MAQAGFETDLAHKAIGGYSHRELGLQDFDRDVPGMPEVSSEKYDGHTASADLAANFVPIGQSGA
jgi:hypothetical protein